LAGLRPKISVEGLDAALETRAVVSSAERLNPQPVRLFIDHVLDASTLTIAADRIAEAIIDRRRLEERLNESLTVSQREIEDLVLLDCPARSVLNAGQDEIRHRTALQRGGAFY
jgi:Uri superfamily endonuclease